jgi:hypothetical protein
MSNVNSPVPVPTGKNGFATAAFVLALVAFIAPFAFVVLTFPMAILALIFGIIGFNRSKAVGSGHGFSVWAIVLSGFSILVILAL